MLMASSYGCGYVCYRGRKRRDIGGGRFLECRRFSRVFGNVRRAPVGRVQFSNNRPFLGPRVLSVVSLIRQGNPCRVNVTAGKDLVGAIVTGELTITRMLIALRFPKMGRRGCRGIANGRFSTFVHYMRALRTGGISCSFGFILYGLACSCIRSVVSCTSGVRQHLGVLPLLRNGCGSGRIRC